MSKAFAFKIVFVSSILLSANSYADVMGRVAGGAVGAGIGALTRGAVGGITGAGAGGYLGQILANSLRTISQSGTA